MGACAFVNGLFVNLYALPPDLFFPCQARQKLAVPAAQIQHS
jgi:hypothetical protein